MLSWFSSDTSSNVKSVLLAQSVGTYLETRGGGHYMEREDVEWVLGIVLRIALKVTCSQGHQDFKTFARKKVSYLFKIDGEI